MQELDDNALLREYVEHRSERAFATLVTRHINKVYAAALRQTGNPSHAEEITQAVFVILARKAPRLLAHAVLSGWLYQTARLASVTFLRSEIRRARREQEAHMQSNLYEQTADPAWEQLTPMLDEAMASLGAKDRDAVVLHFFDGKSMKDAGNAMASNEEATKKRVYRAVEKLRRFFTRRGVTLSTAVICGFLGATAAQAAPAHLAGSVAATAFGGSVATASTLTLVKGVLKFMTWMKAKTAIVVGTLIIVTAGTTTMAVRSLNSPADADHGQKTFLPGWGTVINPDGDCTLTVTNGRLTIRLPGSDHVLMPERGRTNAPRVMQEIEGDFDLQVKVSGDFPKGARTAAKGRHPYQDAGLILWLDDQTNLKLARAQVVVDGTTRPYFNFEYRYLGKYVSAAPQLPKELLASNTIYIQLKRRGDTLEAGLSANGRDWLAQELPPGPLPKKLPIGLIAQHNTYSPLTVTFEDFNVNRP